MRSPKATTRSLVADCLMVLVLSILSGCAAQQDAKLAVDKMPREEMLSTGYLELNEDNPGVSFNIDNYLVPGKYTIVLFYSPYDNQCMSLKSELSQLPQSNGDVVVRTVNINRPDVQNVDWDSPIIQDERLQTLPYLQIFEPSLELRAHGRPAHEQVKQWLQQSFSQ